MEIRKGESINSLVKFRDGLVLQDELDFFNENIIEKDYIVESDKYFNDDYFITHRGFHKRNHELSFVRDGWSFKTYLVDVAISCMQNEDLTTDTIKVYSRLDTYICVVENEEGKRFIFNDREHIIHLFHLKELNFFIEHENEGKVIFQRLLTRSNYRYEDNFREHFYEFNYLTGNYEIIKEHVKFKNVYVKQDGSSNNEDKNYVLYAGDLKRVADLEITNVEDGKDTIHIKTADGIKHLLYSSTKVTQRIEIEEKHELIHISNLEYVYSLKFKSGSVNVTLFIFIDKETLKVTKLKSSGFNQLYLNDVDNIYDKLIFNSRSRSLNIKTDEGRYVLDDNEEKGTLSFNRILPKVDKKDKIKYDCNEDGTRKYYDIVDGTIQELQLLLKCDNTVNRITKSLFVVNNVLYIKSIRLENVFVNVSIRKITELSDGQVTFLKGIEERKKVSDDVLQTRIMLGLDDPDKLFIMNYLHKSKINERIRVSNDSYYSDERRNKARADLRIYKDYNNAYSYLFDLSEHKFKTVNKVIVCNSNSSYYFDEIYDQVKHLDEKEQTELVVLSIENSKENNF